LVEKLLKPGSLTRAAEPKQFGRSEMMLTGRLALNAARWTLSLTLENRAVGGKSKSGAITITSTAAISTKPANLTQQFILATRDNSMFRHISFVKYGAAGQLGLLARCSHSLALLTATPFETPAPDRFGFDTASCVEPGTSPRTIVSPISNIRCCFLSQMHIYLSSTAPAPFLKAGPVIDNIPYLVCSTEFISGANASKMKKTFITYA